MKADSPSAIPSRAIARDLLFEIGSIIRTLQRKFISAQDVHQTRNNLTRMRASLRLLRGSIGNRTYHQCNTVVRDAGRQLNAVRDAEVLIQTVGRLRTSIDSVEMKRTINLLIKLLIQEQAALQPRPGETRKSIFALQAILHDVNKQLKLSDVIPGEGLVCAYKNCRKAFRRAQKRPTDANLHEWRKQMKYMFCETEALSRYGHGPVSRLHRQASLLATYLGDDHDLVVLQTRIGEIQGLARYLDRADSIHELAQRMQRSRARLQRNAFHLGMRCFRLRPRSFRLREA